MARDEVAVHIMGGLGNQLFQFAVGLELSRRKGSGLRLIVGDERDRPFELDGLARHWGARVHRRPGRGGAVWRRVHGYLPRPFPRVLRERAFRFDERILEAAPPVELIGYFQSWRYFQRVGAELRASVESIGAATSTEGSAIDELGESPFVALHVRRGDYVGLEHYHGLVSERYLADARRRFVGIAERCLVFTDDPVWTPSVDLGDDVRIVRPADLADPLATLLLMSRARAIAISNSSFSWWAAWLGDTPGRPVIAPSPWFTASHLDTSDLLPPHWEVLPR